MAALLDICRFTPTAGGTGDWTYSNAVTGYQGPSAAGAVNGLVYSYRAEGADLSQWEIGYGAYNSVTRTFARATVLYNSAGSTAKINFSAPPQVAIVALKEDLISIEEANNFTTAQQAQARSNVCAAPFDALAFCGMQINGSFDISQEISSNVAAFASGSVSKYIVDGVWGSKTGTSAFAVQQVSSVFPGYTNELKLTVSTAQASIGSDQVIFAFPIEGYRFKRAAWGTAAAQPITVGVWIKSSAGGTVPLTITDGTNTISSSVTASAGTAQFVTATFPGQTAWAGSSTTGVGASLKVLAASASGINIVSSTSNTLEVTGLIILPGIELPVADRAPFIMRPFDQEIIACMRQYQTSYKYGTTPGTAVSAGTSSEQIYSASGTFGSAFHFYGKMRAQPTLVGYDNAGASGRISYYDGSWHNGAASGLSPRGDGGFIINTAPIAGPGFVNFDWVADARLPNV